MGFAHVNVMRVMAQGRRVGAGEIQLIDPHHPIAGPMTNVFLFGSFKGKIASWREEPDMLALNTHLAHATTDGRLDYRLVGRADPDPYDPNHLT
ncbi:hypothetical protein [Sinorhizobium meliloti]|uniref:hypothetical protein n=1 Tax=Rhizobium meliloti TaxID=382 RepID=UPI001294FE61|nr:hypothetical protein [Sinorhizobium meliloti]MDE3858108.1 hypothetical protein [Sinorhizobium meliloti]MQW53408.1 hypothetical protein [Sinorhizobium meliloti]